MKLKKVTTVIDWDDVSQWEKYMAEHQKEESKKRSLAVKKRKESEKNEKEGKN